MKTEKPLTHWGVEIFKLNCDNVKMSKDTHGTTWWEGGTCEGGGAVQKHRLNEQLMTPVYVVFQLGHIEAIKGVKKLRALAESEANKAIMRHHYVGQSQPEK